MRWAIVAIWVGGCAAPTLRDDLAAISAVNDVPGLEAIASREVDPLASEDARAMLSTPLAADDAVRVAMSNNREIRAQLRDLGVVRGEILEAGLLPNPVAEAEFLPERETTVELRVEYEITGVLMAARRRRALTPELEAARYRVASAVIELGYRVRASFYRAQASKERLAIAQRMLDALAAARDAAAAMLESGGVRELDLATQVAAYERGRVEVAEIELEYASHRERLARLMGVHGDDVSFELEGDLPRVPDTVALEEDLEVAALRANLEVLATRRRIESLSRRAGVERLEGSVPSLAVDVHGLVGNPRDDVDNRDLRVSGGVTVGIPVFDRRQGRVVALLAEMDATLERFYGLAVAIRSAARDARNHLVSAHRRARHFEDVIVPAQARVTEHTMLQYNAMQIGIFELLAAHREELDARLAHIEARREFWTAAAAMDALLAGARVGEGD